MPPSLLESPSFADAENLAQVVDRLGGIPLDRIVWKPFPGTATEADQIRYVDGDNKRLVELLDGILVEKAMVLRSSYLAMVLGAFLFQFVRKQKLGLVSGPDGIHRVTSSRNRLPDLSFTRWERLPSDDANLESVGDFIPDLCVEILSDGNTKREMAEKRGDYFEGGCQLVWIVDPEAKTIAVYTDPQSHRILGIGDTLDGGTVLPGFALSLAELFGEEQLNPRKPRV